VRLVAKEQTVSSTPWSLDTCSTQHSPVHRVRMRGVSNRDTRWYPPHNNLSVHLTTTLLAALWVDHRWNGEWLDKPTRLCTFIPDTTTNPPGMTLPRTAWVRLNRLCTVVGTFPLLLTQMGYGPFCGL